MNPSPDTGGALLRLTGTGPVVMALALWLRRQGVDAGQIEWIGSRRPLPASLASRAIALSAGSIQLLGRIVTIAHAAPILEVDVRVDGHAGSLRMRSDELDLPALGSVVRYGDLHGALESGCERAGLAPRESAGDAPPALEVCADGDPGDGSQSRDFDQAAILAEIEAERDAAGAAFERFTGHGPLALLPLPESHRHALVWCDRPAACTGRMELDDASFEAELEAAFGTRLGRLRLVSARSQSPLVRRMRAEVFDGRRVLVGNAAQALHPVAGQGLNLGLRDAFELSEVLGDAISAGTPLPNAAAEYARRRSADRRSTVRLTDTLAALFGASSARALGATALAALDLLPLARRSIAHRFMFGLR